jgi:Amino acid permease
LNSLWLRLILELLVKRRRFRRRRPYGSSNPSRILASRHCTLDSICGYTCFLTVHQCYRRQGVRRTRYTGWSGFALVFLSLLFSEYWLSSVKIVTILVFILVGAAVNGGLNEARKAIGFANWVIGDAPFVGGFGGFATVFVTAALSCETLGFLRPKNGSHCSRTRTDGGTESLGITAGETKDPARNMPRVIKYVFFRYA